MTWVIELVGMKRSPRFVVLVLAVLIMVVVGWPFARRYHPMAAPFFEFAFLVGTILLPFFLEWLDRRTSQK
jgi:hypothetical protein